MSQEQWYETFPDIFREEKQALEERGFIFDEESFETRKTVIFKGHLPEFPERNIIIEYPRTYPSTAPIVSDDGACDVLPRHQKASNRAYCLFGPECKEWCARNTGAFALDETARLLRDELGKSEIQSNQPDPNPEPPSAQAIFAPGDMILVPPGISDYLPQDLTRATSGMLTIKYSDGKHAPHHKYGRGIVLKVNFSKQPDEGICSPAYKNLIDDRHMKEEKGVVIFLPKLERPIYETKDFIDIISGHGFNLQSYPWHAVVFPEESENREKTRYSWLIFHRKNKQQLPVPIQTITYRTTENSARIPGLEWLPDKRVAIIGCGSIGSKVAAVLASSGVKKFILVDKDHMEPSNSIRHECGVETFAYSKTLALAQRLASINPECCPDGFFLHGGDPFGNSTAEHFDSVIGQLQKCDLIINTSGNDRIGRFLNQFAYRNQKPCLHASATNGAWSGEVIRSIPGRTRCWQCWDYAFADQKPPGEPVPDDHVFGPGCDQPTFTGTSYEVGMIANLAASFAVDTLRSVELGDSEYSGDYLLWEGKDANGKPLLRTTFQEIPHREKCPVCGNQT
jgi:molybdopterin/thiamine biosynthesis adenylyltransferase